MNDTSVKILFDSTNPDSLTSLFKTETQRIHDFYGCVALSNSCTSDEIALLQWGSSNITKDFYGPYKTTSFLRKTGISVTDLWNLMPNHPEYLYYESKYLKDTSRVSPASVGKIVNNITGITDLTQAAIFYINVTRGINLDKFEK